MKKGTKCDLCYKVIKKGEGRGYEESDEKTFETIGDYFLCFKCAQKKGATF